MHQPAYELGLWAAGWANNEQQVYQASNAQVVNGALVLTANYDGTTYTSARLRSFGLQEFVPNASYPDGIRISANIMLPQGVLGPASSPLYRSTQSGQNTSASFAMYASYCNQNLLQWTP